MAPLETSIFGFMSALLEIDHCSLRFGGIAAVEDVSFSIAEGELTGLIGPNGAGKTSLFNLITGVYQPTSGSIRFEGRDTVGERPSRITARGIARTFQNIRLFSSQTVHENVQTAANVKLRYGFAHALTRGPVFRRQEEEVREDVARLLELFGLSRYAAERATDLSYGDQRRVEIARALATKPRLLLLDEPAAGMNPQEKKDLMELIRFTQAKFGVTILLVEHDMGLVMGICRRIVVLDQGRLLADGEPAVIRRHPDVIRAYLGGTLHVPA